MKNKKLTIIFILIASLILICIGATFAYFTSRSTFDNLFSTGYYKTVTTEVFTSPETWAPGDTTQKELFVKNEGNIPVKVKISYTEIWETKNGEYLPLEQNGERVSIINLANSEDWEKVGANYFYKDILNPGESTSSFIESVTFNSNINASLVCNDVDEGDGIRRKCVTTGEGYDQGKYTLTFKIETVQSDYNEKEWAKKGYYFEKRANPNTVSVGDELVIGSEHFYVLYYDGSSVTAIAKYNLLVGDIVDYDNTTSKISLYKSLTEADSGYGLQNSAAKGYFSSNGNARYVGVLPFSAGDCYIDYDAYVEDLHPLSNVDYSSGVGIYNNDNYNGYNIIYYMNTYSKKLKSFLPNNLYFLIGVPYSSDIKTYSHNVVNQTACENYCINKFGFNQDYATEFCSGGYDKMNYYLSKGFIGENDYELAGLNVTYEINSFAKNGSYWLDDGVIQGISNTMKDGELSTEYCSYVNYYGFRPYIYMEIDE